MAGEEIKKNQTLKKARKLLFPISLFFSLFFAIPLSFFFPSSSSSSINLRFHLFNQPIDKNSMFILCNALLVFLANYSGLFKSLSPPNHDSVFKLPADFGPFSYSDHHHQVTTEPAAAATDHVDEQEEIIIKRSDGSEESIDLISDEDRGDGNDQEGKVMSDEELNRKFDEFIKRMKEEIVVDAPTTTTTTLVVV